MDGFQFHLPLILIVLATSVGVLTTVYAAYYLNRYERTKQVVTFTVLATTITIWTFFALLQLTATTYGQSYWAYKMLHFGSFTTAPAVLLYGLSMGNARRWVNWKTTAVIVLLLSPVFVLLFTDPTPALFENPHLMSFGAFSVIDHGNSLLYISYLSAFYIIATIGLSYIVYQTWSDQSLSPSQTAILVSAIFAPMLLSVAHTFSLLPFETPGTILTPTSFSVGMAGVGYAAFRYETFDTKALARSRTIENMREGYLLVDTTGRIIDANQSARSLLGVESPLTGMQLSDLIPTRDGQVLGEVETTPSFETQVETGTETRTLEISSSNFTTQTDQTLGTLLVIQDITTRKQAQQQLEEQRNNLELLNQVLRHDIRNDLQVVAGYGDLLTDYVDEDGAEYLTTLRESANHSVELTKTARDMADVMLSREDAQPQGQVNLRNTLEQELEKIESEYPDAHIVVEGALPAVQIQANQMLDSVFRNLLSNAVQHNDKEVPEVSVSATTHDMRAVVRIADNGPGVPDSQKQEIFGEGEKGLDSSGTGLGLYLVQELVTHYGGEVWVEDNNPEGAVFAVELPLANTS
ncbi:histidine kinase N-terminal 7TM domain-containing protein [Halobellus sp. H-GB7]|uniref:histidine kinase N-terminal 7TM domain-containing protein n=1 Tax=Halobellus sp. H-GB7 TaxID=3069756 RepID=UPI0027B6CAA7|nr:histidine kinase N-terminal 7TM domain-containing protein [Halobellus sp. H-GB7]MDQ2054411.1 histidine kinase N-terminal 7TM domain-containing protein [Halobellus sp. H-GB7]